MATCVDLFLLSILICSTCCFPESGKWNISVNQDTQLAVVTKHMYKDSKVDVSVALSCKGIRAESTIEITWLLRSSPCAFEFNLITELKKKLLEVGHLFLIYPYFGLHEIHHGDIEYVNGTSSKSCKLDHFHLQGDPNQKVFIVKMNSTLKSGLVEFIPQLHEAGVKGTPAGTVFFASHQSLSRAKAVLQRTTDHTRHVSQNGNSVNDGKGEKGKGDESSVVASPREASKSVTPRPAASPSGSHGSASRQSANETSHSRRRKRDESSVATGNKTDLVHISKPVHLTNTSIDGNYMFIIRLRPINPATKFTADVTIQMYHGDGNYISALDQPLLIFYAVIGVVYILFGFVWLTMLVCNWRDLLRVQFWISGVIFLGMLEKAVFFAVYEDINNTGVSVRGAIIFAELVSCLKRALSRMLVIVVSYGFGIIRPRLGQTFHKVLLVGVLYFALAAIEGSMRSSSSKVDQSNQFLLAATPLAVLDAIVFFWIFTNLAQSMKTLRLRRNLVKLSLYRNFTNTLIFAVIASAGYMIWFVTQHKFKECVTDWKQLWVDDAFWHVLFGFLLLIIMILWRPTANNNRYAFSPLLDEADEEDENIFSHDAFDGMKMRGARSADGSPQQHKNSTSKVEDDLKFVEENIPSSLVDRALPSLMDSDEEVMNTKFEMSKME